jgi:hypothetical protein
MVASKQVRDSEKRRKQADGMTVATTSPESRLAILQTLSIKNQANRQTRAKATIVTRTNTTSLRKYATDDLHRLCGIGNGGDLRPRPLKD